MINLRPATLSDVKNILGIHYAAVHGSTTSNFYSQNILQSWSPSTRDERRLKQLHQAIRDNTEIIIVAESTATGMIMGFGSVVPSQQELRAVYVDPTFARQGVGTKIITSLEELAVHHVAHKLHLDASLNAESFYCHHGYSIVERAIHRLNSGIDMDCIKMSKELHLH
ncbi:unnamed protein product [Adineta steineri]|uniref:N-acetyltransferase domain-containing protein n=1 Tax=Adineta steineri TaxID=433720 RepID=A0A819DQD8_9BILA|nr:unnamed protein product [Adineta steineri]CAF3834842.1 unnamed protein product [Adineta steineri]